MRNIGVLILAIIGHIFIYLLLLLNYFVDQNIYLGILSIGLAIFNSVFIFKEKYDESNNKSKLMYSIIIFLFLMIEAIFSFFLDIFNPNLVISKYSLFILSFTLLIRLIIENTKNISIRKKQND